MNTRKLQRKQYLREKKAARVAARTDPLRPVRGTPPGFRRDRTQRGGGNAVRKTMKVFRAAYKEEVRARGFDPARLQAPPPTGQPVPEGWVRNPEFDKVGALTNPNPGS